MKTVFVCPDCQKSYAAEFDAANPPRCPKCNRLLLATNKTRADWDAMSREERLALLGSVPADPHEQYALPEFPRLFRSMPSVVEFVDEHIPGVSFWWKALLALFVVALAIGLVYLVDSTGYVLLIAAGSLLAILTDLYLACCFCRIAILKGHVERMYLWIPFIFTIVGYLMVVALPDRAGNE